jgi:hypothetical protein
MAVDVHGNLNRAVSHLWQRVDWRMDPDRAFSRRCKLPTRYMAACQRVISPKTLLGPSDAVFHVPARPDLEDARATLNRPSWYFEMDLVEPFGDAQ